MCLNGYVQTNKIKINIIELKKENNVEKLIHLKNDDNIVEIILESQEPLIIEKYDKCEELGRIAIMDAFTCIMIAHVIAIEY